MDKIYFNICTGWYLEDDLDIKVSFQAFLECSNVFCLNYSSFGRLFHSFIILIKKECL